LLLKKNNIFLANTLVVLSVLFSKTLSSKLQLVLLTNIFAIHIITKRFCCNSIKFAVPANYIFRTDNSNQCYIDTSCFLILLRNVSFHITKIVTIYLEVIKHFCYHKRIVVRRKVYLDSWRRTNSLMSRSVNERPVNDDKWIAVDSKSVGRNRVKCQ